MISLSLCTKSVSAVMPHAARQDVRYYLNAIFMKPIDSTSYEIVATDGHSLAIVRVWTAEPNGLPDEGLLIPGDIMLGALKASKGVSSIELSIGDKSALGVSYACELRTSGQTWDFRSIDGRFPDYMRLLPKDEVSGESGQFSYELLARFGESAKAFGIKKKEAPTSLIVHHNGDRNSAIVRINGESQFVGVIMPYAAWQKENAHEKKDAHKPAVLPDWLAGA